MPWGSNYACRESFPEFWDRSLKAMGKGKFSFLSGTVLPGFDNRGSGGWGNRLYNDGIGGRPGYAATNDPAGTGNYGGNGISPGLATNNTGTTLVNTTGTFTLSPAV